MSTSEGAGDPSKEEKSRAADRARAAEIEELERKIARGEKAKAELPAALAALEAVKREREKGRTALRALHQQITDIRQREADKLNRAFEGRIVLTLERRLNREGFRETLETLFKGSTLVDPKGAARSLSASLLPYDLIDAVEGNDVERVGRELQVNEAVAKETIGFLRDHPQFNVLLERLDMDIDELRIDVLVDGRLTPIEQTSPEVKANTMRSIMLRQGEWNLPRG